MSIEFCTPIYYGNQQHSIYQSFLEFADDYFFFKGNKAVVDFKESRPESQGVDLVLFESSWQTTVLKIISYFTIILPLILFSAKVILRSLYHFHLIQHPPSDFPDAPLPDDVEKTDAVYKQAAIIPKEEKKEEELYERVPDAVKMDSQIPPDILLSPTFEAIFKKHNAVSRNYAIINALWILSLASEEEKKYVPIFLEEIEDLIKALSSRNKYHELLVESAIAFFEKIDNLKFNASLETARRLAEKVFERVRYCYFHGTHIIHVESIRDKGISIQQVGNDPEVEKLHRIAVEALNRKMFFGYYFLNCSTEEEGVKKKYVYLSADPFIASHYAKSSPEWVSEFFGNSNYESRNKAAAKEVLEQKLKFLPESHNRKLTEEEAQQFRDFFEKTWEKYKEFRPTLFKVLAPAFDNRSARENLDLQKVENCKWEQRFGNKHNLTPIEEEKKALSSLIKEHLDQRDCRLEKSIPPSQVAAFILPPGFNWDLKGA